MKLIIISGKVPTYSPVMYCRYNLSLTLSMIGCFPFSGLISLTGEENTARERKRQKQKGENEIPEANEHRKKEVGREGEMC